MLVLVDFGCRGVLMNMLLHSMSLVLEYDSIYILGFVINLKTLDHNLPCKIIIVCFFVC